VSGQVINPQKSTIYGGSISQSRQTTIANSLGFTVGTLPFLYLGVPIFKGKPKTVYFQPVVDKIKSKLTSWKASLLSYVGRSQLLKSVILSMTIYSITIYAWPVSLIKQLERLMRNFLWSGNFENKKLVTISWKVVCSPIKEGGFGLRSLSKFNEASSLKLGWELMHSQDQWASFLRRRVKRGKHSLQYHIYSSIWSGIKEYMQVISENSTWLLGNGNSINFWLDNWCGDTLVNLLNIPPNLHHHLKVYVSDFIHDFQW